MPKGDSKITGGSSNVGGNYVSCSKVAYQKNIGFISGREGRMKMGGFLNKLQNITQYY